MLISQLWNEILLWQQIIIIALWADIKSESENLKYIFSRQVIYQSEIS